MLEQVGGLGPVDPSIVLPAGTSDAEVGRRLLGVMLDDPSVALSVQELVENPPEDEQMSVELAIAAVILLGLLVTWLQTKMSLRIDRRDGKIDVHFDLTKAAAPPDVVKNLVKIVATALGISS